MGSRTVRHLIGAGTGLVAAPAIAFLMLRGIQGTMFLSLALLSSHPPPGYPPGTGIPLTVHSLWLSAVEFIGAATVAGVLAGARRISPVGPLVAGLPFLMIHFYAYSGILAFAELSRHVPASWMLAVNQAIFSDAFLLLGGALAVSAIAPWRWRIGQASARWANWHALGVIAGMAAVPLLWFILQLSESATAAIPAPVRLAFAGEFLLLMIVGAIAMGVLASWRWLSPVAAVIAGAPLAVLGLFTLAAPTQAQSVIDRVVYGDTWQLSTESLAASGWLVLFGGMVLVAGVMPGRWRRGALSVSTELPIAPGSTPGQGPEPGLAQLTGNGRSRFPATLTTPGPAGAGAPSGSRAGGKARQELPRPPLGDAPAWVREVQPVAHHQMACGQEIANHLGGRSGAAGGQACEYGDMRVRGPGLCRGGPDEAAEGAAPPEHGAFVCLRLNLVDVGDPGGRGRETQRQVPPPRRRARGRP